MDAARLAAGDREVTPRGRTRGEHDGVELRAQRFDAHVDTDVHVHPELGALGLHLRETTVEVALLPLELGEAVPQQAADAVGALEHDDRMARACELLRGGETGRSGADDR